MSILSFARKNARKKVEPKTEAPESKPSDASVASDPGSLLVQAIGLAPIVTEKSVASQLEHNTYVFRVKPSANKAQIMAAVEERYDVRPLDVRTINMAGKKRRRGRVYGRASSWKKAYVTLPPNKSIDYSA